MSHIELAGLCLASYWVGLALHLTLKNAAIAAFRIISWLWARRPRFVYLVPKFGEERFIDCIPAPSCGAGDKYQVTLSDGVYLVNFIPWTTSDPVSIWSDSGKLEGYAQRQYMERIVRAYRAGKVLHGA